MNGRHNRERNGAPLRDVFVARTVAMPQPEVDKFLNETGRAVSGIGAIRAAGSTHITFLESRGIKNQFRREGFTRSDVQAFSGDLELFLDNEEPLSGSPLEVRVDPKKPFIWKGPRRDKLALNIVPEEEIVQERQLIEGFLDEQFGNRPDMRPFDPHVTIGEVNRQALTPEERRDPSHMFPLNFPVPQTIALNGLVVYLDRIEDK